MLYSNDTNDLCAWLKYIKAKFVTWASYKLITSWSHQAQMVNFRLLFTKMPTMPTSEVSKKKKDYVAAEYNIVLNVCRKITIEVKL